MGHERRLRLFLLLPLLYLFLLSDRHVRPHAGLILLPLLIIDCVWSRLDARRCLFLRHLLLHHLHLLSDQGRVRVCGAVPQLRCATPSPVTLATLHRWLALVPPRVTDPENSQLLDLQMALWVLSVAGK